MKTIHSFMGMALCSFPVMAQQSPNFLIIQCDHLTQRVVGAYGADPSCTPPIDRIASQGVTFANAYVGCPLSQPSRAALWSGLMPHQTNVRSNSAEHINPPLPDSIPTLGTSSPPTVMRPSTLAKPMTWFPKGIPPQGTGCQALHRPRISRQQ